MAALLRALLCVCVYVYVCVSVGVYAQNVPFSDTRIQYLGRFASTASGAVSSWSGTTVAATFTNSTSVSVFLSYSGYSTIYYYVFVDGQASTLAVSPSSLKGYVVASGLSLGSHNISIVRKNEASFGPVTFYGFGLASGGSLQQPAPRPSRRIEFIGDSITCGYGDTGYLPCSFSAETEDVYQAHGPITARALGADYYINAWSGMGMVRNYGDQTVPSAQPFPAIYDYTVGGQTSYGTWDYSKWIPHAVVINLGTNDYSTSPQPSADLYKNGYINFVNHLKTVYASAVPKFFLVCGPMSQDYCSYAQQVASTVGGTFINLWGLNVQPYGCDYHPTVAVQTKMAAAEISTISSVMGWQQVSSSTSAGSTSSTSSSSSTTGSGNPTGSEAIYTDSLGAAWLDYSWATVSLTNTNPARDTYSISFALSYWQAIYFHRTSPLTLDSFSSLSFWVNGGVLSGVPIAVTFFDNSATPTKIGDSVSLPNAVQAGVWVQENMPISSFNIPANSQITGVVIQYNSDTQNAGTIYVDDVSLVSTSTSSSTTGGSVTTTTTTAAPTTTTTPPTTTTTTPPTTTTTKAPTTAAPTTTTPPTTTTTKAPTTTTSTPSSTTKAPTTTTPAPTTTTTKSPSSTTKAPTTTTTPAPTTPAPSTTTSTSSTTTTTAATGCASSCSSACVKVDVNIANSWPSGSTMVYQVQLSITNLCSTKTLTQLSLQATGWNPVQYWNLDATGSVVSLTQWTTIAAGGVYTNAGYQNNDSPASFTVLSTTFQ